MTPTRESDSVGHSISGFLRRCLLYTGVPLCFGNETYLVWNDRNPPSVCTCNRLGAAIGLTGSRIDRSLHNPRTCLLRDVRTLNVGSAGPSKAVVKGDIPGATVRVARGRFGRARRECACAVATGHVTRR